MPVRFALAVLLALGACRSPTAAGDEEPASASDCDNDELVLDRGLVVVAPHPDDETLGFAGPIRDVVRRAAPVRVVVLTDGDANCMACGLWKRSRPPAGDEPDWQCDAGDRAAFSRARRAETRAALAILGVRGDSVTFLGHGDGSLAAALEQPGQSPPRPTCGAHPAPPPTGTGDALVASLARSLAVLPDATVLTTHPLDTHGDHAAAHALVRRAMRQAGARGPLLSALIHHPELGDCGYPPPAAPSCAAPSADELDDDPDLLDRRRGARLRPELAAVPAGAVFGAPLVYCLAEELTGAGGLKHRALLAYQTQLGAAGRDRPIPARYRGWSDWLGYLFGFVRSTEVLYRISAAPRARDTAPGGRR